MFEEIYGFDDILQQLRFEQVVHTYEKSYSGTELDSELCYTAFYDTIHEMADAEIIYLEDWDNELIKIYFPGMNSFYSLCHEHSRRHRINFRKNPYVKSAEEFVNDAMRHINSYSYSWGLYVPKKLVDKRRYCLIVETDCYFDGRIEMIEAFYRIRDYYRQAEAELRNVMYPQLKVLPDSVNESEERKAA